MRKTRVFILASVLIAAYVLGIFTKQHPYLFAGLFVVLLFGLKALLYKFYGD